MVHFVFICRLLLPCPVSLSQFLLSALLFPSQVFYFTSKANQLASALSNPLSGMYCHCFCLFVCLWGYGVACSEQAAFDSSPVNIKQGFKRSIDVFTAVQTSKYVLGFVRAWLRACVCVCLCTCLSLDAPILSLTRLKWISRTVVNHREEENVLFFLLSLIIYVS